MYMYIYIYNSIPWYFVNFYAIFGGIHIHHQPQVPLKARQEAVCAVGEAQWNHGASMDV